MNYSQISVTEDQINDGVIKQNQKYKVKNWFWKTVQFMMCLNCGCLQYKLEDFVQAIGNMGPELMGRH